MHNSFDAKGMQSVSIILLTHKMQAKFPQFAFESKLITPQVICDCVEMIGFGCELLGMAEISHEQRKNFNQMGKSLSESSLDSVKIRGEDDME